MTLSPAALVRLAGGQALRHPLVDQLRHGHPAVPSVMADRFVPFLGLGTSGLVDCETAIGKLDAVQNPRP